jgi:hypothetical protein
MKKNISQQTEEKIFNLINAALERYSHEELFSGFLETITAWKDREAIAALISTDEDLTSDVLSNMDNYKAKITDEQTERMKSILERKGYTVFECKSLAEQIKLEQFITEIESNPYQLNLIA